jgi:hypothetical protein
MQRIRLIHWNATEAKERAVQLCAAGYAVEANMLDSAGLRRLRDDPPDGIVIDLNRRPAQGRDVGLTLRKYVATRRVPLVFVGGAPAKVDRIREFLPDAVYTTWGEIEGALQEAIAHPPIDPVVPDSLFDVYAGTPLPKKLGIKAGSTVVLIGAPDRFEATLGELPEGAVVRREAEYPSAITRKGTTVTRDCSAFTRDCSVLTLWFVRAREELDRHIGAMGDAALCGGLWIIWPKKSSGVASDLSQPIVRQTGLASGLVDFKVCSLDKVWTGLRFSRRKE